MVEQIKNVIEEIKEITVAKTAYEVVQKAKKVCLEGRPAKGGEYANGYTDAMIYVYGNLEKILSGYVEGLKK